MIHNSYEQLKLLNSRVPVEKVLADPTVDSEIKRKLRLSQEALKFGVENLSLAPHKNYQTFVELHRPYVTWIVQVAPLYDVTPYTWWFPIVGSLPYKGFFDEESAHLEAEKFDKSKYDRAVRGASAFSTLGWFHDPILSSMLKYQDADLIETIIHESVHATLFISGQAEFNERMANFLGTKGTELFYSSRGENELAGQVALENADHLIFSDWISNQIVDLNEFYKTHQSLKQKEDRLNAMMEQFKRSIKPKLKTNAFLYFEKLKLNNAVLLNYTTYDQDLSDFEKLYKKKGSFKAAFEYLKTLKNSAHATADLKGYVQ